MSYPSSQDRGSVTRRWMSGSVGQWPPISSSQRQPTSRLCGPLKPSGWMSEITCLTPCSMTLGAILQKTQRQPEGWWKCTNFRDRKRQLLDLLGLRPLYISSSQSQLGLRLRSEYSLRPLAAAPQGSIYMERPFFLDSMKLSIESQQSGGIGLYPFAFFGCVHFLVVGTFTLVMRERSSYERSSLAIRSSMTSGSGIASPRGKRSTAFARKPARCRKLAVAYDNRRRSA